jgi:hypothetical protein
MAILVWPVAMSFQTPVTRYRPNQESLRDILQSEYGFNCFQQFLVTEFNVENLLFYKRVHEYQQQFAARPRPINAHTALLIYSEFITSNAPFQINLPSHITRNITATIEQVKANLNSADIFSVYDEAVANVYRLMETDVLPRFKKNDLYHEYLELKGKWAITVTLPLRTKTQLSIAM